MSLCFFTSLLDLLHTDPARAYEWLKSNGECVKCLSPEQLDDVSLALLEVPVDDNRWPNKIVGYLYIKINPYTYEQVIKYNLCTNNNEFGGNCLHCRMVIFSSDEEASDEEDLDKIDVEYAEELHQQAMHIREDAETCQHGFIVHCDICESREW
jgi:hypothetical protein